MPHRFVLERAVGTHSNSVQRALCPLTSTYSVVYLFSQSYFNTKFIIAPRHSGFIPFCALSAAKGMVIRLKHFNLIGTDKRAHKPKPPRKWSKKDIENPLTDWILRRNDIPLTL